LPEHKPYDHAIDLKPETPETIWSKVYPMPLNEQGELDRFLEKNLRKGYIAPSKSPIASPVFFIKKKDGKLRLVQDYRKLNELTIKNCYPLPLASDIVDTLAACMHAFCGLQGDLGGALVCLRGARERALSVLSKRRERGLRIASEMQ
jgi:hypothetical protein